MLYYFSLEAVLQGMIKNNPTEKQNDAEMQATLKEVFCEKKLFIKIAQYSKRNTFVFL